MADMPRVLIIEDLPSDAELMERETRKVLAQSKFKRVETREDFLEALASFKPGIILSDYKLPRFDGLAALELSLSQAPEVPFIMVTGSMNEDTAVECMKAGAWDYVIKEHILRLGPAVRSSLEQQKLRQGKKLAEETLARSAREWHSIFDAITDAVCLLDLDGRILRFNDAFRKIADKTEQEILGYPCHEVMHGKTDFIAHCPKPRAMESRRRESIELESGNRWFQISVDPVFDESGAIISLVHIMRDITEQKRAQAALADSEKWFRNLTDSTATAIFIFQKEHFVYANKAAALLSGYGEEELRSKKFWEIVHPDFQSLVRARGKARLRGESVPPRYEFKIVRKDGDVRWVDFTAGFIFWKGEAGALGTLIDITERKVAEKKIRESEELYRNLFDNHSAVKLMVDPETGRIIDANEAAAKFYGWPREKIRHMLVHEINTLSNEQIRQEMENARAMKRIHFEFRHRLADGSIRDVEVFSSKIEVKGKDILHSIVHDITERKLAEAERERLMAAIEQTGETIIITDPKGTIQYVNPAFGIITGFTRQEAIGQNPRFLKSGEHDGKFYKNLWQTISAGRTWKGRLVNKRKDGTFYSEDATISAVFDGSGKIVNFVAVKRDITDQLQLEAQYLQAQKMESVGRLAGGVAHDFNNMLTVILGNAELALAEQTPKSPIHANLQEILNAGRHSADLTRQLLAFARRQTISPIVIELNELIESTLKILRRLIGEDIELVWLPGPGLWPIMMDPSQVDQILANLCVNARDAIAGVGQIILETENLFLDESYCALHPGIVPGGFVALTFSDDGCGMDKETQGQIFEPFFTTKDSRRGTGLGLATIYGIIKQNSGFINVYSEPGQGTTFKIFIPRYSGILDENLKIEKIFPPKGHGETVLLVEDEASILNLTEAILKRLGYSVLASTSPREAIRLAKKYSESIHLVITDVVMPEMNGRELTDSLKKIIPKIKTLFSSGYTASVIAHHGVLDDGIHFIQKPYSMMTLAQKVREILES